MLILSVVCSRAVAEDSRFGEDFASAPPPSATAAEIVILHTNDIHGQVYPQKAIWLGKQPAPDAGGFSALASLIRKERESAGREGKGFLLLDAGDIWSGTPEANRTEGGVVVDWMNLAGYDAIAIGNHEFDAGAEKVEPLARASRFPWLGANVVRRETGRIAEFLRPAVDRVVGGVRVTIIGAITAETKVISSPRATRGFEFTDPLDAARAEARAARARGAEVVILLSHCGLEADKQIAGALSDVDAIVGGHTHQGLDPAWRHPKTKVLVAATFSKGSTVGKVTLKVEKRESLMRAERERPRRVTERSGALIQVLTAEWPKDAATDELLAREVSEIHAKYAEVIGEAEEDLRRAKGGWESSPLGNWLADLMRERAEADIAIHNKAGIRADIPAGPVALGDLYQVSPYGNTLAVATLTGAEVREEIEHALSGARFALEVSGIEVRYDIHRPLGDRVVRLWMKGAPLSATDRVRVVTNSFLAQGGDGHFVLAKGEERSDLAVELLDLHAGDLRKRGKVRAAAFAEPRIAAAEATLPGAGQ